MKLLITYWTSTGNTEKIANELKKKFDSKSLEVTLKYVSETSSEDISHADLVLFGASAMGVETIDDSEMAPFIDTVKDLLVDKPVAVFGSYDWGDGEWLRDWKLDLHQKGAKVIEDYLMIQKSPDIDDEDAIDRFVNSLT